MRRVRIYSLKRDSNQHVGLVLKRLHEEPVRTELIEGDTNPPRITNLGRYSKMADTESRASARYESVHGIVAHVILACPGMKCRIERPPAEKVSSMGLDGNV